MVPVATNKQEKITTEMPEAPSRVVCAIIEQSGDISPVDLERYGKRAGEIIARAAFASWEKRRVHWRLKNQPRA